MSCRSESNFPHTIIWVNLHEFGLLVAVQPAFDKRAAKEIGAQEQRKMPCRLNVMAVELKTYKTNERLRASLPCIIILG